MNIPLRKPLAFLLLTLSALALPGAARADSDVDSARRADDTRTAATMSGDPAKLAAIFSDDLTYVHSTGMVNHKADFIKTLSSGELRYFKFDYEVREFQPVAPGLVLMRGRVVVFANSHGKEEKNRLSFLAAYRNEGGVWRFLAWQSCKLGADSPPWPK